MPNFNPFYFIKETKASPHALTLRSSLWEKIKDTFWVLNGSYVLPYFSENEFPLLARQKNELSERKEKIEIGVLDYLTLGLSKILGWYCLVALDEVRRSSFFNAYRLDGLNKTRTVYIFKWKKLLAGIFLAVFWLPSVLLNAAVALIALAITATFTIVPIIPLVHFFSTIKGDDYRKEAVKAIQKDTLAKPTHQDYKNLLMAKPVIEIDSDNTIEIKIKADNATYIGSDDSVKKALLKLNIGNCLGQKEKEFRKSDKNTYQNSSIDIDTLKVVSKY